MSAEQTVGEIGEFALLSAIQERLNISGNQNAKDPKVFIGIGDDSAVVSAKGNQAVACIDVLSQGVHFRLDWSSASDVGHKAAAANLADIFAMGASPTALLVGLALPADTKVSWVLELADGLAREAARADVQVVGGDIVRSESITVSVTALGELNNEKPILRSGAKPGDVVAVAGQLGFAQAGLLMLSRGFRSPRSLVNAHRAPTPPYELAAAAVKATSMIDISDGLISDLTHIAKASNVEVNIQTEKLVIADDIAAAASAFTGDALDWVLNGGEDHAFAATFSNELDVPAGWNIIGSISTINSISAKSSQAQVLVDGQVAVLKGWDHFSQK
jgi:thiamine-monophosphate kinase